jgi:integrase
VASTRAPHRSARNLTSILNTYIHWTIDEGVPLDPAQTLDPDLIERFAAVGGDPFWTEHTRGTYRSNLLRIARSACGFERSRTHVRCSASKPSDPYTDDEIDTLRRWANAQPGPDSRRDALALLALGLGGGMSADEILEARVGDFRADDGGMAITLSGSRGVPRTVRIDGEWGRVLFEQLDGRPMFDYAFRPGRLGVSKNGVTNFVDKVPCDVRCNTQRMRTTWIVQSLRSGVERDVLAERAGMSDPTAMNRYLRLVRSLDEAA